MKRALIRIKASVKGLILVMRPHHISGLAQASVAEGFMHAEPFEMDSRTGQKSDP